MRNGTGRIVIVGSRASITHAPVEGIMFDNLDGRRFYKPFMFYGQSKLANALFAKELSRRLTARGIAVNSVHPGATRGTGLNKSLTLPLRIALAAAKPFFKSARRGAATQALLAASPQVSGVTGEYSSNCQIAKGNPLLEDLELARRLWDVSQDIVSRQCQRRERAARGGLNGGDAGDSRDRDGGQGLNPPGQGLSCARISPGRCSALWTLTYNFPALKFAY